MVFKIDLYVKVSDLILLNLHFQSGKAYLKILNITLLCSDAESYGTRCRIFASIYSIDAVCHWTIP